jgi:hypothetical protein
LTNAATKAYQIPFNKIWYALKLVQGYNKESQVAGARMRGGQCALVSPVGRDEFGKTNYAECGAL